jgi:hypothetical protein
MGTSIKFGLLGALAIIALQMICYLISPSTLASWTAMLFYLPLLFLMIYGGITYRREIGGYQSFGQAFLAVFIIGAVGSVIHNIFSLILFKYIDPSLTDMIKQAAIENTQAMMEKFNTPDAQVEEALQRVRNQDYAPSLRSFGIGIISAMVFNTILTLIIAAFVRRDSSAAGPQNLYK